MVKKFIKSLCRCDQAEDVEMGNFAWITWVTPMIAYGCMSRSWKEMGSQTEEGKQCDHKVRDGETALEPPEECGLGNLHFSPVTSRPLALEW
jgi:hypothetical protein